MITRHMVCRIQYIDVKTGRFVWHSAPIMSMQEAINRYNINLGSLQKLGLYEKTAEEITWYKATEENMNKILTKVGQQ